MEKQQNEALKAWLHRYGELQRDANRLWNRLEDLRGRAESACALNLDGMPHARSTDADRIGGIVAELEELELEAQEAQQSATTARREISAAIKHIHGIRFADRREVLRLRYSDCLPWEDVAEKMFGDDPRFWDKSDVFLRRCFKLHTQALEELSNYVPLQTGQENNTLEDDRK